MVEVERSAIEFAPYNPRTITEQARKRLKAAIGEIGILGPVIWNKRSGRLVGGHQRIRALDALAGGKPYRLNVSAVDLSDEDETAANLLLNNPEAAGEWDMAKLGDILKASKFNVVAAGLGSADIYRIVGDESSAEVLADCADRIEKAREIADATRKSATERNSPDFYLVVVFKDETARDAFTDARGLDRNRYQSGEDFAAFVQASS
jgi:hypothetical protein